MRKEKRPFVVEVKRAAKRGSVGEGKLFEAAISASETPPVGEASSTLAGESTKLEATAPRRILDALPDAMEHDMQVDEEAPKRRGRKPGSKNKPKVVESVVAKRRGRPPNVSKGAVRQIAPTPDIVNAALSRLGETAPAHSAGSDSRTMTDSPPTSEQPVKRGRGRPRKIVPPGGFPPRVPEWVTWLQTPDEDEVEAEPQPQHDAVVENVHRQPAFATPSEFQVIHPAALVAGMRWTRRLRGGAAAVVMRRSRKA